MSTKSARAKNAKGSVRKKRIYAIGLLDEGGVWDRDTDAVEMTTNIDRADEVWVFTQETNERVQSLLNCCKGKNISLKYRDLSSATQTTRNAIVDYCASLPKETPGRSDLGFEKSFEK